ncbi:MAG: dihydroorotate dehydrogenase-like protein [Acidimicrobiales bacterium]
MTTLATEYLGLDLANPIVASSSPLTGSIDTLLALEHAGAAAVVLPSLFEEQVEHDSLALDYSLGAGLGLNAESHGGYFPELDDYDTGDDRYLDLLIRAKAELKVPVIASLNGTSEGGWTSYASAMADKGADALELNIYLVAANPDATGVEIEDQYLRLVESVRSAIEIPLAVKIGPWFSSPGNMARRLAEAGADALVLFNRFYLPDIDLETLEVTPDLVLSTPIEMRLTLRWIAIMAGAVEADLAATTGVHSADEVVKLILAGAQVAMMSSALLIHGPEHLATVLAETGRWFADRDYASVDQARGSVSQASAADPTAFERANYMKTLSSYAP